MTLTFTTLPLSTNSLYAHTGSRRFLTNKGKENKDAIAWEARAQYRGQPLKGALVVEITLFWKDKRRHDVDNIKGLLDALTGILWEDDNQIEQLMIMKAVDKENPHVELRVWPLEN